MVIGEGTVASERLEIVDQPSDVVFEMRAGPGGALLASSAKD